MAKEVSWKANFRIRPQTALLLCTLLWCYVPALSQDYYFHIQEELPSGTTVGAILTHPGVTYQFNGNPTRFSLDSQTGVITTTSPIDRDSLNTNPVELKVRSSSSSSLLSVSVEVEDINDNPPVFPSSVFSVSILESEQLNSNFPIDAASDIDSGENGTVDYAIISGNDAGKFKLGRNVTECIRSELCIITQGNLNREEVALYQLNISATDRGKPSQRGYCLVNITVLDFNDNHPVFTRDLYNASVDENSSPQVKIVTVSATDKDQGSNGEVRYYFEDPSDSDAFDLDETTGVIKTKAPLDYEQKKSYIFEVIARDRPDGALPLENKTTVEITVRDLNEYAPEITIHYVKPNISEDEPLHTLVAVIVVSDRDGSSGPNGHVNVTLSNAKGSFRLVPDVKFYGLETVTALDYETVPFYNITVGASDKGVPSKSTTAHVLVQVTDVNDEVPMFTSGLYTTSITEKAQNGSFVYRVNASDSDIGSNSQISYSIYGGNSLLWFHIDSASGLITTARPLDRELIPVVKLTVLATDHGSPPLNSSTTLQVTIRDVNDNPPEFTESDYNETVNENSAIGTTIITLKAMDEDSGDNGNVTYAFDSSSQGIIDAFNIDQSTGVLTTKIELDHEAKSFYDIAVIASDHGNPPLSSRTLVHLFVLDVNDNHPMFYPLAYVTSVLENEPPHEITQVTATDPDKGTNGTVTYSIVGGDDYGNFSINESSGVIRTLTPLDNEVRGFYQLNVTARDGGGLYAKQAAVVEITVQNQLDNPPEFEHGIYNFSVYENAAMGTFVGKVFATTKDKNSSILYSIVSGDPQHLFIVDDAGGIIMVDGVIDREENDNYLLHVVAKVGIQRPLSAFTSVSIDVLDRNDNQPEFKTHNEEVTIDDSMAVGKEIYQVAATDLDAGQNGVVQYQLTVDGGGLFKIDGTSGVVSLARKITSIDSSWYLLPILASDMGAPPLHSTLMLTVIISTNHPPRFLVSSYSTQIPGDFPVGKRLLAVRAIDQDSGDNGIVAYSIASKGNEEGIFGIFPDGTLYVKSKLDRAKNQMYTILVIATDGGNPPISSSIPVLIHIQTSNHHEALFANGTFHFSIHENQLPGTVVGQLVVKATNSLNSKKFAFSLSDAKNYFIVNSVTGEITAMQMFDREKLVSETEQNVLKFQAQVFYNDSVQVKQDTAIVIVTVLDLNDNPPQFSRSIYFLNVKESSLNGTFVYRVTAFDLDEGIHANFTFSIVGGSGKILFYIDPSGGDLYINGPLDREKVDHYTLTIRVTDILNVTMFSEALFEIIVQDINDNKPVFTQVEVAVNISEDYPVFSQVAVVKATDRDEGVNSEIAYAITSGNLEAVFDVNHLTGEIFLIRPLDYERTKSYILNISAVDRGKPPKSSMAQLKVNVLDANDNQPKFQDSPTSIHVQENVTVGTEIGQCSASDDDSGRNKQITYSINRQFPKTDLVFEVNPLTCAITVRKQLDFEKCSFYTLVVKATDNASPEFSELFTVKKIDIYVEDINDNKPRFTSAPAVSVDENFPSNKLVMTVSAEDPDSGRNKLITYHITSGNTGGLFHLDTNSGELFTNFSLAGKGLSFQLVVSASDSGNPALMSMMSVTVFKRGQLNGGPTFSTGTYKGSIEENSDKGTSVLQVQASYTPTISNSDIKYYITSDTSSGLFTVDEGMGIVRTALVLDRETLQQSVFSLDIFAVDLRGPNPRTSNTKAEITVLDENDNSPVFNSSLYTARVRENIQPGSKVITVYAADSDEGLNAKVEYSLTDSDSPGLFQINSSSGEISTHHLLDHKHPGKYTLNVTAVDHGNPIKSSSCVVMITVLDVNDNSPSFFQPFYSFGVFEGVAIGNPVGVVSATDADVGQNSQLTYSIVGSDKGVFSMDPISGSVTVAKELDRERVPIYILNVSASDNGMPYQLASYVEVYVNVLDRNDNAPRFVKTSYTASVSEAAQLFSRIITVSATDGDFGTNARVTYTILSGNSDETFGIYNNGTIYNLKPFDREKKSSYIVNVMARDQAVPVAARLSSIATVMINITDINDNKPHFISPNMVHISENAELGDIVTRLVVVDPDVGSNSQIIFGLIKHGNSTPFRVCASDGLLRLAGYLDREVRDKYTVQVTATDKGIPPQRTDMSLTILVDDYNDKAPSFLSSINEVYVYENISIGSEVRRFSAKDDDQGTNSEVRYSIVSGNNERSFKIDPVTGLLETVRALDRETTPNYTFVIRASDLGVPQQSNDTVFTVILLDVNDNTPTFAMPVYTATVPENRVESNIITVKAEDNDEGKDGRVLYEITGGNDGNAFKINIHTAELGLNYALNRETHREYTLVVRATDEGYPPHSSHTTVIVTVSDENDSPPVFLPDKLEAFVSEDKMAGTVVAVVTATDDDTGKNANIEYSLANDNVRFSIDKSSGKITTKLLLNRERGGGFYNLEVVATDQGNPPMESRAHVRVIVQDVNDNNPTFSTNPYTATVKVGSPPGTFVVMVSAKDDDLGPNAQSEYTITSNSSSGVFSIDSSTGIISVTQNIPASPLEYILTVKATNVNARQRTDTTDVRILVSQGSFPSFIHRHQSIRVSELAPVGTVLIKVNATGHTGYFIAAGNIGSVFEVDQVQGEVKVKRNLDFEKQKNYAVVIGAKDGNTPPRSGFVSVYITVIDENDNPPVFNQSVYRAKIAEELPQNTTVLWVFASDADTGANAEVEYFMLQENSAANVAFEVTPSDGRVFTKVRLDRENISSYSFKIRAEDVANRSANNEAVVVVEVEDVDDNAPVIEGSLTVSLYENASVGGLVAELKASDRDVDVNAPLRFSFVSGTDTDNVFSLDPATGYITLSKRLNREQKDQYTLELTVDDSHHTTTVNFTVHVLDVNDNPPRFKSNTLFYKIKEQSAIGSPVMNVTAIDDDIGVNAKILYFILPSPASNYFTIDRQTGVLRPKKLFMYRKPTVPQGNTNLYNLTVEARNPYSPFYSTTVDIVLEVIDENDHPPEFESPSYHFFAVANQQDGDVVGHVQAFDEKDDGLNAVVRYKIVSGNGTSIFRISAQRGSIAVSGTLNTLGLFLIRVKAEDSGQPVMESFANVSVEVIEDNQNSPKFTESGQYTIGIFEDMPVGDVILTVTATDQDNGSNGKVSYHIIGGDSRNEFGIGVENGSIYVNKPLDYELYQSYQLNVSATDGGRIPKSQATIVAVTIKNINDNPPVFTPQEYVAYVAENEPSGAFIVTVTAVDPDNIIGSQITYSIATAEQEKLFRVDANSGEVRSKVTFDFEVKQLYELSIIAEDGGNPSLQSQPPCKVGVHITGVNEFVPRFSTPQYRTSVAENALVGQSVTQISATDRDLGPGGEVVYELVGDSNSQGFTIDQVTGVLSVSGKLDSEQANTVTLRVIAKNAFQSIVGPNTSDYATVVVTVTDANDAPRFLLSTYPVRVKEDVNLDSFIVNVTAVDDDAKLQSAGGITYEILDGNINTAFSIDSVTGVITTAQRLDRESVAQYHLTVTATDQGVPPMQGNATVLVNIDDVNDNAPHLVPIDCSGLVLENKPAGTTVMTLQARDDDLDPNRGPYTFAISGTDYGSFHVDSKSGVMTTTALLDREITASYNLSILVSDNGSPIQAAISSCLILIKDENDNPPKSTARLVHVNSFQQFTAGVIAKVPPEDPDVDDSMSCRIVQDASSLFSFPSRSCVLNSRPYSGSGDFDLSVNGSDGKSSVLYNIEVRFIAYNSETLNKSVIIRLKNTNAIQFLEQSYQGFVTAVENIVPLGYVLQMFSVKSFGNTFVDLSVALRDAANSVQYMDRERVSRLLSQHKNELETNGKVDIQTVDYTPCAVDRPCLNSGECTSYTKSQGTTTVIESISVIFLSVDYVWHHKCVCKPGFTGADCGINEERCSSKPCLNGGTCVDEESGYTCYCLAGYGGINCQTDIDECTQDPCTNGGRCENVFGGYKCHCRPGFLGKNCSSGFDFCRVTTCLTTPCTPSWAAQKCYCSSGAACQCACIGFDTVSYLKLPTLESQQQGDFNNITFQFSTTKKDGLLLYNADGKYQKDSDFIAIEVVDGKVRLSFNLGDTDLPIVVNVDKNVADGQWHTVVALRNKKNGDVSVDSCCRATLSSPGNLQKLDLYNSPLYIGGVKDFAHALYHPGGHIQTDGFVGCMRDIFINGKKLDPSTALESARISDRCPRLDQCSSQPCKHGGKCVDYWFDYICECTDGYSGRNCEEAVKPVKFSSTSFLVLEFKESYRREQELKEKENNSARKRRAVASTEEMLSVRLRTRHDGLVLLAEDSTSDYTLLEIKSGEVVYSFNAGGVTDTFSASSTSVTDGEWHNVTLRHQENSVTVTLDNSSSTKTFNVPAHDFLGKTIQSWYLGGFNSSPPSLSLKKFQGCMEDLNIDGLHVPFSGPNKFLVISTQGGAVVEGCDGGNLCSAAQCSDPEKPYCFQEWESYTCISDKQCKPNPCDNTGTCLPQKDGSFLCNCSGDFRGDTCSIPGVCWPHPCGEKICQRSESGNYECVTAVGTQTESSLSAGVIAAIVFLVALLIFIVLAVICVRRYRARQKENSKAAAEFDALEVTAAAVAAATDVRDASQRTSPSHSSDDSGVVIRNPSQKSLTDLRPTSLQHGKDIVIHNVGAPEDYQIKLTRSEEKIDPGFSESDGEYIMQNNLALAKEIPVDLGEVSLGSRPRPPHYRSTPLEREAVRQDGTRNRERKILNPHFRHGIDKRHPLSRSVLDPRLRGQTKHTPSRRFRKGSLGSSSSDDPPDFSDAGHKSDDNSERLEHYDIEVASLGYSEVSYQYDPNTFRDNTLNRREPPGLSAAEIEKLRKHPPSGSLLDAVSSTSGEDAPTIDKLSSVLEVPDTSSESSDDTFTCSEFEYDNDEPIREDNQRGKMVFSKLANGDTARKVPPNGPGENEGRTSHRGSWSTVNASDDEVIANTMNRRPVNGESDLFNWDDVLNWGLRYHNLRGVYKDIAQLKDSTTRDSRKKKDEEYV